MNDFKKKYQVVREMSDMEKRVIKGKKEKERIIELTKEQEERNKIVNLINKVYNHTEKLTEEEKREFLAIKEDTIPTNMLKKLYQLAKAYVEGKTIDFEKLTQIGPSIDVTPARTSRKNTNATRETKERGRK